MQELRWAVEAKVPIQPVVRMEDKGRIGEFMKLAPSGLQCLGGIDFVDVNTADQGYLDVAVGKIDPLP